MSGMALDLRIPLDLVAVAHFNTEHPHVHVALRGMGKNGTEFKLWRDYVNSGLRVVAQHGGTAQMSHRTEQDPTLAFRRQVPGANVEKESAKGSAAVPYDTAYRGNC